MTLATTVRDVTYTGSGSGPNAYAFPFPILAAADLIVERLVESPPLSGTWVVEATLTLGVDYTVLYTLGDVDGEVNVIPPIATTRRLRIRRVLPITQPTDLRNAGAFDPAVHENALDRLTMIAQQLNDGAITGVVTAGEVNTGANVNTAGVGVFDGKTGVTLNFRGVKAGAGIAVTNSPGDKTIEVAATVAGLSAVVPPVVDAGVGAIGVATAAARADHKHALTLSSSTPAAVAAAGAAGTGGLPARADHVHAHGNQAGGALHAIATSLSDGFLSAADKAKLDLLYPLLQQMGDDFTGNAVDNLFWNIVTVSSGTDAFLNSEWGARTLSSGATAGGSREFTSGQGPARQRSIRFDARVRLNHTSQVNVHVGLADAAFASRQHFAEFFHDGLAANWQVQQRNGASTTLLATSPGVPVDLNWRTFSIILTPSTITYLIDGVTVQTSAVNMPGSTTPLRLQIRIVNLSATTVTVDVDYLVAVWQAGGR